MTEVEAIYWSERGWIVGSKLEGKGPFMRWIHDVWPPLNKKDLG